MTSNFKIFVNISYFFLHNLTVCLPVKWEVGILKSKSKIYFRVINYLIKNILKHSKLFLKRNLTRILILDLTVKVV